MNVKKLKTFANFSQHAKYKITNWSIRNNFSLIMAALLSRCRHYTFVLWFLSSVFLSFPRLF